MDILAFDPETGQSDVIFSNSQVMEPGTDHPFEFSSFQWSGDSQNLVFRTISYPVYRYSSIGDYFLYNIESQDLDVVARDVFTGELSPDGSKFAYHKDGNMFVFDIASGQETQLTFGEEENVFYGRFGWVYEEEFGLVQAWNWSPDSRFLAFWKSDERDVPLFKTTDYEGTHPEWFEIPFPKVGDVNPIVEIGVVDLQTGKTAWMDLDLNDGYAARLYWTSQPGKLAVVHLNRPQTHLSLHFYDALSGKGRLVMEEKSEVWIDVFDFFAGIDDYFFFPEDKTEFFWISDRNGWKHIYRFGYDGKVINQVTEGEWQVTFVHAVDAESGVIYYTSTEESPLERHLYRIGFDGSGKERLTVEPGRHLINMGPNGRFYFDRYSNIGTPRQVELWGTETGKMYTFVDNHAVSEYTEAHFYAPMKLFTFTASDGQKLDGSILYPDNFDPSKKYPLVLSIYGGPSAQGVYNMFHTGMYAQYLAQSGYFVANVNNRGSGGYGRDFEKIVYLDLGKWEANDFVETARYLSENHAYIDGSRMAIQGHSYGGYMSALTMVLHPGVFKAGIVAAPVTDWRLYDTIYTERYMGLLEDNLEGYERSSVMAHVDNLEGRLLIAHSAMDENVHLQNTMQLLTALTSAGKDADVRIYPPGNHGVAYDRASFLLLYQTYLDFLDRHLKK